MNSYRIKNRDDYDRHYRRGREDAKNFWAEIAENFEWMERWEKTQSGSLTNVDVKWFEGAKLNITVNCLDRHLKTRGEKTALIHEPSDPNGAVARYTYRELHHSVCKAAHMLQAIGVQKGDRVCLSMGMVPELLITMLACARIGAIHSVALAGLESKSLADRISDAGCTVLVTGDGAFQGDKIIPLKDIADEALKNCPSVKKVIVHRRGNCHVSMEEGRDLWWHEIFDGMPQEFDPRGMEAEDPLFILYTSGSTGRPKGILHTCAGYMVWTAYTFDNIFQMQRDDIYWCAIDIGWITGHSYMVYGPLLNGASLVMYEGALEYPDRGRLWEVVDKYRVTHLYGAPAIVRAVMAHGAEATKKYDLRTLKVMGSVRNPIAQKAWLWYCENVDKEKCRILDTWWQTETGAAMLVSFTSITEQQHTFEGRPLPGVYPVLLDERGKTVTGNNVSGNFCIERAWPGMARSIYGDHRRFEQTYFKPYPGHYFTGDNYYRNELGLFKIKGRADDIINVAGNRLGTIELENIINQSEWVVESAVVGFPHEDKGQGIYVYIVAKGVEEEEKLVDQIKATLEEQIGIFARPDKVQLVSALPKTRSGKITHRILRAIAEGNPGSLGDMSALLNPNVVEEIRKAVISS
ncbi:MAG: acetate--CoA ligase [Bacteriovoracales bacterium]|nr:acetate--CoA ligase [Bacteriovoracales bacterium]